VVPRLLVHGGFLPSTKMNGEVGLLIVLQLIQTLIVCA
jgi:hypothetical protein